MLAAILTLVVGQTWTVQPSADVWVYPHASSPGADPFMRVWGDGSKAIDSVVPPGDEFSYGYLQFDLEKAPKGKLTGAKLIVWNVPNPELKDSLLESAPLEVYGLKGSFKEETFSFTDSKVQPFEPVLGKAKRAEASADGIRFEFNLLDEKGTFSKWLDDQRAGGTMGLALTSRTSPTESRAAIYKINTKEGPEKVRPTLELTFE